MRVSSAQSRYINCIDQMFLIEVMCSLANCLLFNNITPCGQFGN